MCLAARWCSAGAVEVCRSRPAVPLNDNQGSLSVHRSEKRFSAKSMPLTADSP